MLTLEKFREAQEILKPVLSPTPLYIVRIFRDWISSKYI